MSATRPENHQYILVQELPLTPDSPIVWDSRDKKTLKPPRKFLKSPDHLVCLFIEEPDGTIRRRLPLNVSARIRQIIIDEQIH